MRLRLATTVLATVLSSFAATAADDCQIRALALHPGTVPEELHVQSAANSAPAGRIHPKTFLNHESDPVKRLAGKLAFTTKAGATDASDRIGTCELPANAKSVILVFIPEIQGKPACKVIVVDDSPKAFPPGSIHVLNLSSMPVRIELEKSKFEFKPGEIRPIPNPPAGANGTAAMSAMCQRSGVWEKFSSGAWPHPGPKRVLQILTEAPDTKQIEIRGFRDVAAPH